MRVLINLDLTRPVHTTNWSPRWKEYCREKGLDVDVFDLQKTEDAINRIKDYDIIFWHFNQYNLAEMLESRCILYAAKNMGIKTFPAYEEAWHFDDKVAEMYALQAVGAPIPHSEVYYDYELIKEAANSGRINFPIVAKLRTGSGSHNVKLIKNKRQLLRYARKMLLGNGFNPAPSLFYKASSNIRSSHNKATFMSKARRIPEFLRTLKGAKKFPNEKGYVYLQEFIPNDNYDMKVVVVNGKCAGFCRPVRSHDFRASGGGELNYDNSKLTREVITSAFQTAERLNLRCVGFDYVIDKRDNTPKIIEMSYGFLSSALTNVGGYYDKEYNWHDGGIVVEDEIVESILRE